MYKNRKSCNFRIVVMHDVFLSHSSIDKPVVEEIAHRLRRNGIEPWLDKWNLIPGNSWQEEIEQALDNCKTCAVFIGSSGMGPWQNEEIRTSINRRVNTDGFRVIPVLLPGAERDRRSSLPTFLTTTTWVQFQNTLDDEDAFHRLIAGIRGISPGATYSPLSSETCPYRGLQVFDVEHFPLFFGREALTEWLLEAIRPTEKKSHSFLAMVGSSGSGKSSLARAGLLAQLKQGKLPGSENWPQVVLTPGIKPLESLAIALCSDPIIGKNQNSGDLIDHLYKHESQLHWTCRQALHGLPENYRVVVLVDQFEELFTLCNDDIERQAFIDNLLAAATDVTGQTLVVLTLRADFYGKCANYPKLADALSDNQFLITPIDEAGLRELIEFPALRTGCELEGGLVDTLLHDVKNQSGSLPLLEYTLTRLWEQRKVRVLRLSDYQKMGGLEGGLNQHADKIYLDFSNRQKEVCQHIFLRLVQLGEGTEGTRRRADLAEFDKDESTTQVLEKLTYERLIVVEQEFGNTKAYAEVTHEALIRGWAKLRSWIEADRESLRQQQQVNRLALEWEQNKRDEAWLLTGTRLQIIDEWFRQTQPKLSDGEHIFLDKSRKRYEDLLGTFTAKANLEKSQRQLLENQILERKKALTNERVLVGVLYLICMGGLYYFSNEVERAKDLSKYSSNNLKEVISEVTDSTSCPSESFEITCHWIDFYKRRSSFGF